MKHGGKIITEGIKQLIETLAARATDRSTLDELHRMAGDRGSWHRAHELFQRIRRKSLETDRTGDEKLQAQYSFEEACAKTLYNLSGSSAPFDADSPYWIVPNALVTAGHFGLNETDILKAILV